MLAAPSTHPDLTYAALAGLPEWTALPPVASLAGVPLACTEDTGSHSLNVQDGDSKEKQTRVSWDVLAEPAPDLPPSGARHRHKRDRERSGEDARSASLQALEMSH